jgi:Fe-S-cluster containining protein
MNKKSFICKRCGECCRHYVLVSRKEIESIKKLGFEDISFVIDSPYDKRRNCLKMVGNDCMFLCYDGKKTFCKIYEVRPTICRTYPFFNKNVKDCRPKTILK